METIQYTTEVPDDLLCVICEQPPLWPRFCSTCWKLTCRDCQVDTCCVDQPCDEVHGRGRLGERLSSLPCQCPVEGCEWKGLRGGYLAHYTVCSSSNQICPFSCGSRVHLIHDRWHWLTCSGYQAYMTDYMDNDPVKATLAIKIERRMRQPLVLEEGVELKLPQVGVRWRVLGYQWKPSGSYYLNHSLDSLDGLELTHSQFRGDTELQLTAGDRSSNLLSSLAPRSYLYLETNGGTLRTSSRPIQLWLDGLV